MRPLRIDAAERIACSMEYDGIGWHVEHTTGLAHWRDPWHEDAILAVEFGATGTEQLGDNIIE